MTTQKLARLESEIRQRLDRGLQSAREVWAELSWGNKEVSRTTRAPDQVYDEHHYFAVPFLGSDSGIRLYELSIRSPGVPAVNDLPKQKILHLPSPHYEKGLRDQLIAEVRISALSEHRGRSGTLERLPQTATNCCWGLALGLVSVGGLAALWNPIVGMAITSRALIPGGLGVLNTITLEPVAERVWRRRVLKEMDNAEQRLRDELSAPEAKWIVNPLLAHMLLALETTEAEHDPLLDPCIPEALLPSQVRDRWILYSVQALQATFGEFCDDYGDSASV